MAQVVLKDLKKVYENKVTAVEGVNLEIADKEFIVLVGPSGCGKSTTLRMVAGLEEISGGELYIDGRLCNDVDPKDRDIAMVFQTYALYPHMTVRKNISFPLEQKRVPKDEIARKVEEVAKILGITEYLDRKPKQLSGGQRQRVAIGRAIVREPKVLLMDEPLSNLDAKLRGEMRTELKRLHRDMKSTFVYVTHDQLEAMTLSTKICLMNEGNLQQYAPPLTVYNSPANLFVADFVGNPAMNIIAAAARKTSDTTAELTFLGHKAVFQANAPFDLDDDIALGIRPEFLPISDHGDLEGHAYSTLPGGMETTVKIKIADQILSSVVFGAIDYETDQKIRFSISGAGILLFSRQSGQLLASGRISIQ